MASTLFCSTPKDIKEPSTLVRQHSGVGDAYSVVRASTSGNSTRYHDEPEADYDLGPTELYRCIETKQWDAAMARLESHPFEAKTWISRKEHNTDKTRWRLLPIHATCIFRSPLALIEALIEVNPDGPQMKDDQGMLPLHLACRNGASKGVVLTLLNAFPDSYGVQDRKGRTPLDLVEASSSQNAEAVSAAIRAFQMEKQMTPRTVMVSQTNNNTVVTTAVNEVDYEHRTILFRLLLKKDWNGAIARAESFPHEAATWIVTKGFNGNLRFLPVHKACVLQPPDSVIQALPKAHPDGAISKDQDGWLPIHCACFYGASDKVVKELLAANVKNGFGYTPLAEARALENPKMDPIIHVLEKFKVEQDKIKIDSGENAIFEAKLDALNKRVIHLERMLGNAMEMGAEIKASVKKAKDPYTLIDRMASRLANLDGSLPEEEMETKSKLFGRKQGSRSRTSKK